MKIEKNIVVVIPCYEPSEHNFIPYIEKLLNTDIKSVVIVNDGSGEQYSQIFERIREIGRERVHVIEYPENKGKGYAMKTAFKACSERFDSKTVFVTADCDGQHRVEDVINVGIYTAKCPGALVLGVRDFSLPCVPKRSRTGNRYTIALMKFFYNINVSDTQTGLRGFSYSLLEKLIGISGDRFEYETNQLIILNKKHVPIKEVKIETVYEEKADDVDKVSHFRTFGDSAKVIGVLLKNMGWYFFSSVISSVLDVVVFAIMFGLVLRMPSLTLRTLIATVTARVVSSAVNFTCNYKLAFNGSSKKSIYRYYILWICQLGVSFSIARTWAGLVSNEMGVSLLKAFSDILLALLSYQIQSRWVFAYKKPPRYFYGGLADFSKGAVRLFTKKYDSADVVFPDEGKVYVCRHLDMHGCYTTVKSLGFDVHIMCYNMFFNFKDAYRQYSQITFGKNGKATLASRIKAFIPSLFVPRLLYSAKAIKVYRKSVTSYKTIRDASRCLIKKECVLLFPDIEYKAHAERESEIYRGFLLLERVYFKETGRHLEFVPLYISDGKRKIYAHQSVVFGDGDFRSQLDGVAEEIRQKINKAPENE